MKGKKKKKKINIKKLTEKVAQLLQQLLDSRWGCIVELMILAC